MTVAQAVLEILDLIVSVPDHCLSFYFVHNVPYAYIGKDEKSSKKGYSSATTSPTEKKKIRVLLIFVLIPHIKNSSS